MYETYVHYVWPNINHNEMTDWWLMMYDEYAAVQDLLTNPNPESPAQREAYEIYVNNRTEYNKRIKEQARKNAIDS